jgi:ABC-type nitrate/sulfonate/bicarbonate transport system ATPase subunit
VIDNAALPLVLSGTSRSQARAAVEEHLPEFGLDGFASAYPAELSGGMRQRAALLRTVMTGRPTLLLDEPFGALDALTRRQLQDWLLRLHRSLGRTVVFVTHDIDEAVYLGDRVIVLSPRPGTVVRDLTIELPRPRHQGQVTEPVFARHVAALLEDLGLESHVSERAGTPSGADTHGPEATPR